MTPGQEQLVSLLEKYHYLSTSQFYDLLGISPQDSQDTPGVAVRKRLQRLATKRKGDGKPLVIRKFYCKGFNRRGLPVYEHIHYLDRREKRPGSLLHEKALTDVHLAVNPEWWKQEELRTQFKGRGFIIPDALFYKDGFFYFLEVQRQKNDFTDDRGVITKLERYIKLKQSGDFKHYHPNIKDFYVLLVLENTERRDNLTKKMKELGINYGMFKVKTFAELQQNPILR